MPDFKGLMQLASKVTFKGGLASKICKILMCLIICFTIIVCAIKDIKLTWCIVIILSLIFVYVIWRLFKFADSNPQAALMDGTEFLMHERLIGSKNSQLISLDQTDSQLSGEIIPEILENNETINLPDSNDDKLVPDSNDGNFENNSNNDTSGRR